MKNTGCRNRQLFLCTDKRSSILTIGDQGDMVNEESRRCTMTAETIFQSVRERCKGMIPGESANIDVSEVGGTIDVWSIVLDLNLELENECRTFVAELDPGKGLVVTCKINQEI
jgi:hypothetical protein